MNTPTSTKQANSRPTTSRDICVDGSQRHTNEPTSDRLLRLPQVLEIVPIGRSTLWVLVAKGQFPEPVKIGGRCTAWRGSDVDAWMAQL